MQFVLIHVFSAFLRIQSKMRFCLTHSLHASEPKFGSEGCQGASNLPKQMYCLNEVDAR